MGATADITIGTLSLSTVGVFEDFGGVFATPPRRGSGYVLPGVDGEVTVTLPMASYDIGFGVTLLSDAEDPDSAFDEIASAWSSIESAVDTGGTVSIARSMGSISQSATAQNCRAEIELLSPWHARVTISARIVSGWS